MSYPHALVIQRKLFSNDRDLDFVAFCKSSIHQIGD
jgi:hypothetical protein